MIIKFEVNGAWQIYDDVDSLMYRRLENFKLDLEEPEQVLDFTETLAAINYDSKGNPGRVLLTFMNSKQLAQFQVVAFSPIYIMNDQGRTVETI